MTIWQYIQNKLERQDVYYERTDHWGYHEEGAEIYQMKLWIRLDPPWLRNFTTTFTYNILIIIRHVCCLHRVCKQCLCVLTHPGALSRKSLTHAALRLHLYLMKIKILLKKKSSWSETWDLDQIEGAEFEFLGLETRFERNKIHKFWRSILHFGSRFGD